MKFSVFVISGMPGSGKTAASEYFQKRHIPVVRMGELTQEELVKRKLAAGWENEKFVWTDLRKTEGKDIYAKLAAQRVTEFEAKGKIVIEGMRTLAEYDFFANMFPGFKTIFIEAGKEKRYQRLQERRVRPLSTKEARQRDEDEAKGFDLVKLRDKADFIVGNDGSFEEFFEKLRKIID
ncbi:AAA family ATPase [Patescibacteria group bacterium]|nr:AAA family ATPase [Patescibacteria group bacterium]MCL5797262.1 AAA family ATPase [Patescibacteria group bacterium]